MNYYGLDWAANICFFIYVYFLPKNFHLAMLFAIGGTVLNTGFAYLADSVANLVANAVFIALYARAYLVRMK